MILCQNDKQIVNLDSFSGSFGGTHVSHENLSHLLKYVYIYIILYTVLLDS